MAESQVFYYGDNLRVMREWIGDNTVDLVYLDPPFNSEQSYSRIFKEADGRASDAQRAAFEDTWTWGREASDAYAELTMPRKRQLVPASMSHSIELLRTILGESDLLAYLVMMAIRLVEMRRVLKPTGSLYLHCDPTASHYLKVVLDALFGPGRFANEIIWQRTNARTAADRWPRIHDSILFYFKDEKVSFTPLKVVGEATKMPHTLITGSDGKKYQTFELTAPHLRFGETGDAWRGFQPAKMGRCWANPPSVMDDWDKRGLIHWPKKMGAWPRRRSAEPFDPEKRMVTVGDVWTDIDRLNQTAKERLGYPTQKPIALLERIIASSTREGDLVLDPFCGCGTTVEAAQKLGRRWVGIDVTHIAVSVLRRRLEGKFPDLKFKIRGEPEDVTSAHVLAESNPWEFQAWIVDRVGGIPLNPETEKKVAKKGGDRGLDGLLLFRDDPKADRSKRMILSVKAGESLNPGMVRDLRGTMAREKVPMGALLLAHPPTDGMRKEALSAGSHSSDTYAPNEKFPALQILSVADIFAGKKLLYPGWNTSHQSVPPGAVNPAQPGLFDQGPRTKKAKPVPVEQEALSLGRKSRK